MLAAYIFRGITGFGSGLIAIPLLALFMPLTFVVPYISFVDVTASLVHGWRHRRHTAWREVLTVLPFTILGVVLALYLLRSLDTSTLANALGLRGLPKSVFRSTIATVFLIEGGIRLTGYAVAGLYSLEILHWIALSLPLMAVGLYIGGHIHTTITQRQFQRAIGILLIISGIALLAKSS